MALVVFYPLPCSLLSSIPHPLLPSLVSTQQKQTLLLLFLRPKPPFFPFPRRKQSVRVREKGFASLEGGRGRRRRRGPAMRPPSILGCTGFGFHKDAALGTVSDSSV